MPTGYPPLNPLAVRLAPPSYTSSLRSTWPWDVRGGDLDGTDALDSTCEIADRARATLRMVNE